jgi:predicted phosphoadenosine phosphosulfate sulfurtransferase
MTNAPAPQNHKLEVRDLAKAYKGRTVVNGVNFAGIYGGTTAMGWKSIKLPPGHTWKSYMEFLLSTLPEDTADNYIFVQHTSNSEHWPRNRPLSMQCCGDMVARRSLAAIGRRVRPHWFRHGAAKELHDRTRDVVKVKDFLGHESLATTYIYLHTLEDRRGEDGDLLAGVV